MSYLTRGRTPLKHAAVILTAIGLDQQPGDPWGACETVAGALGLLATVPGIDGPARDAARARQDRHNELRRLRVERERAG